MFVDHIFNNNFIFFFFQFLREELKYDSGYEKRHKTFHYNDDTQISVKELWEAWLRSEVNMSQNNLFNKFLKKLFYFLIRYTIGLQNKQLIGYPKVFNYHNMLNYFKNIKFLEKLFQGNNSWFFFGLSQKNFSIDIKHHKKKIPLSKKNLIYE